LRELTLGIMVDMVNAGPPVWAAFVV